ncbi:MAG: hypothetical protein K6T51_11615 [Rubrobacteraceae bacterium]|uniref:hypothetical protein n=1 Tax=Rubrobacter naiadicus TaxID=1392641 RepID=UPI00235EC7D3|nr:hypothetical protein [Rubrobacter naiadicus]MBX6764038.1 hypothetical protein [Rubrobacteraceae bacterium]MCL6439249.1 hypothetical protein [Rubrobacteraceae bacterium]
MEFGRELSLDELPYPPLFRLVGRHGEEVFAETEVGGRPARVGALFSGRDLAGDFAACARGSELDAFAGLWPEPLEGWGEVEEYASAGEDYLLVVTEAGAGIFFAEDVLHLVAERRAELPFPLYVLTDEEGVSPLVSVQSGGRDVLVAALFSSPEKALGFRERVPRLELPEYVGKIQNPEGLSRHAMIARRAGADYAVVDPEGGSSEAIPIEELIT